MAIAFFRISKLPERIDLQVNGAAAVLNQSYAIALENTVVYNNASGFKGEFLDEIGIQVSEDGTIWSEEAMNPIQDLVSVNTPESVDRNIVAAINTTYTPYSTSDIPINNSTDRIRIFAITGLGSWKLNGQAISVGQEIFMHELPNLTFESLTGAGLPYATLVYECGNHIGYNESTQYTIGINIDSDAEIALALPSGSNPVDQTAQITAGMSNTIAVVEIVTSGDMFANGPASTVTINYNGNTLIVSANETNIINVELDGEGEANIDIEHNYSNFGTPAVSNVQLTVQTVDGSSDNVSATDTVTSTVNYT